MTIERALELLPQMRDSEWITAVGQVTAIYTDEAKEVFNTAISALEKRVPMKPLPQEMDIDGRAITPCGFCGEELPHNSLYDFCPYCGQAIDRRKDG